MAKDGSEFSINDMKHLLVDFLVAGTDTIAVTIEWGMAELLHNPEKMVKVKTELNEVIGQKKLVEESDISRLPYLQAVVKEIFRLHPAIPFLVPRKADANVEIDGYIVPKNANVLINAWGIGRDSSIWAYPEEFQPERFLQKETDVRGQHFELIPFGGGRRICPGLPLAYRMVHLTLASLIHHFEWKLGDGLKHDDIDMKEEYGISIHKAIPLKIIPIDLQLND